MSTCRLHPPGPRPDDGLLERCRALPTSILSDCMARSGGVNGVHPVPGGGWPRVAGPALTVRTRPGDNLVVHRALDLAGPGDVLVVDGGGALDRALLGEIIARYAAARGLAALVVDGAVRDVEGLAAGAVPVFARGVNHLGPYKDGPGEIGGPVHAGGTVVRAGDVVVGDADGVVVVPLDRAEAVLASLDAVRAAEAKAVAAVEGGATESEKVRRIMASARVLEA